EALTAALASFEGSMLLVSHDRHLLRSTVDQFWVVAQGGLNEFDGDLDDYQAWVTKQAAESRQRQAAENQASDAPLDRKVQRRQEAETRQRLAQQRKPLEKKLQKLEQELSTLSARKAELDALISDETLYLEVRKDECRHILAEH